MRAGGFRLAVQAAVLAIFMPAAAQASDFDEKLGYCRNCHGRHYEGFIGYYIAPRLAGQTQVYLENQLKAIGKHTRDDPNAKRFMWPVLTHGAPALWPRISKRLSEMDAPPAADGPKRLVEAGNDWVQGHRAKDPVTPADPNTMQPIAKSLNKEQIKAVAAFLSYQK